jgi:UrcA family protein
MMLTRTIIGLAAVAFSSVSFGSAAMAQEAETVSVRVEYADLDLSNPAGQKQLETRIKSAVRAVCGQANSRILHDLGRVQECRSTTMNNAKRDVKVAIANYNTNRVAFDPRAIVGN